MAIILLKFLSYSVRCFFLSDTEPCESINKLCFWMLGFVTYIKIAIGFASNTLFKYASTFKRNITTKLNDPN